MSGMEPLLVMSAVSAAAGAGVQAYGSHMAGVETSRAAEFERQQLEIQAQTQHIAADQAEARRREELTSSLEHIQAIRASRGVGSNSPTGTAILTSAIDDEERAIATERFNHMQAADIARRAALMAGRKARTSLLAGDLTAASGLFSTASRAANLLYNAQPYKPSSGPSSAYNPGKVGALY